MPQYLSFDVATKTLAFVKFTTNIDWEKLDKILAFVVFCKANLKSASPEQLDKMILKVDSLMVELKSMIIIEDGTTVDLFPDTPNEDIKIVPRVIAATKYIKNRIHVDTDTIVIVEFQMGPNNKAGHVEAAIISIFAEHQVHEVHPSLKAKIFFSSELKHHHYTKKYGTLKTANKNHARDNFNEAEKLFTSKLPANITPALKGHIADAFMNAFYFICKKS